MTRQEQIEEITRIIDSDVCNKDCPNRCPYCGALSEREAKKIYDAGYRKVLFDTKNGKGVDCTQYVPWELAERHTKNEVEKTRKETAREILQTLYDKCYEITDEYDESVGNFIGDNDILCLAKHYGVEVEE